MCNGINSIHVHQRTSRALGNACRGGENRAMMEKNAMCTTVSFTTEQEGGVFFI